MNLWETITGSDLTRECKAFEARAHALPTDYQQAWGASMCTSPRSAASPVEPLCPSSTMP
jgi:hypothetical protein